MEISPVKTISISIDSPIKAISITLCLLVSVTFRILCQITPETDGYTYLKLDETSDERLKMQSIPVTNVSVSPNPSSISVRGTLQLTATVSPANATNQNINWQNMSNSAWFSITAGGLVTAHGPAGSQGTFVAFAHNGLSDTSSVTIIEANIQVKGELIPPTSPTEIPAVIISAESKRFRDFKKKVKENQQNLELWMDQYKYLNDRLYPGSYFYNSSYWESYDMLKNWGKK
jgi:hypothetical protein